MTQQARETMPIFQHPVDSEDEEDSGTQVDSETTFVFKPVCLDTLSGIWRMVNHEKNPSENGKIIGQSIGKCENHRKIHRTMGKYRKTIGQLWFNGILNGFYPLVICYVAIENLDTDWNIPSSIR